MYDCIGSADFHHVDRACEIFNLDIVKYYGLHGKTYDSFKQFFYDGDYILTRVSVQSNQERFYEMLYKMSILIKSGGFTVEVGTDARVQLLAKMKELYTDILESYRLLSVKSPHTDRVKEECIVLTDVIGDSLMELRDLEPDFNKLGDYNLYSKYNVVRKQIGKCESSIPRIVDAFRTQAVKQKIEKEFGELFSAIEDVLAPVQEKNLKDYEDKILKLFGEGKTIEEIAKELNVNPNTLAIYMNEHMDAEKLGKKNEQ